MRSEQHVCNIEQGKRLNELGVLQDSIWYFLYYTNGESYHLNLKKSANNFYNYTLKKYGDESVMELCSAYNISELAVMLDLETGVFDPVQLADQLINEIETGLQSIEHVNCRLSPQIEDYEAIA